MVIGWHTPEEQVPPRHPCWQAPQLFGSVCRLVHPLGHAVYGDVHAQASVPGVVPAHVSFVGQLLGKLDKQPLPSAMQVT
jgi:hypothetical protein